MKKGNFYLLLLLFFAIGNQLMAQTKLVSFKVGQLWYDTNDDLINAHGGSIIYYKHTYYWFGEKRGDADSHGVSVYASKDLYNWEPKGLAFTPSKNTASPIAEGCIMERPKVIYNKKTKKFVLWFHLELRGKGYRAAEVGVAESDHITGPYKYVRSFRPNGNMSRDMTIFVDDNGKAYEIYSSRENYDMRIVALTEDYLNVTPKDSLLFSQHREAPAVFKYKYQYYLITSACTGWAPNEAELRVADNLYGPWKVVGNPMEGGKSKTTFNGQPAFILPVPNKKNCFIYVGDKWNPQNLKDSRYQFLPIEITDGNISIPWRDEWSLSYFNK
ncbi:glycoside hydrolase family 43 protein [Arachidicoccus soli]|uniref:Beta-glucanase n=1 Tax=Arachidicoccus soli TaxID=2341117 RepID=A0A386HS41_9BACT|nr:glycoside hydrolase family 43 protein [Arachidicoccus soli]AYD48251.1 beta-glucanase [Arachidicoccus soli]